MGTHFRAEVVRGTQCDTAIHVPWSRPASAPPPPPPALSKIFPDKRSWFHEIIISKVLTKIDPLMHHFVYGTYSCLNSHEQMILEMPYGGIRLSQWQDAAAHSVDYRRTMMMHAIEGLALFAEAGWWHHDLHPGNLVVDKEPRLRWIDFGEARPCGTQRFSGAMKSDLLECVALVWPEGLNAMSMALKGVHTPEDLINFHILT